MNNKYVYKIKKYLNIYNFSDKEENKNKCVMKLKNYMLKYNNYYNKYKYHQKGGGSNSELFHEDNMKIIDFKFKEVIDNIKKLKVKYQNPKIEELKKENEYLKKTLVELVSKSLPIIKKTNEKLNLLNEIIYN